MLVPTYGGATPLIHPTASQTIDTAQALETFRVGKALFIYVGDTSDPAGRAAVVPGSLWWPSAGVLNSAETGSLEALSGTALQDRVLSELDSATGGDTAKPVVFYCIAPDCWLSYNAALRASNSGFSDVRWYRGGTDAWHEAGLPLSLVAAPTWF